MYYDDLSKPCYLCLAKDKTFCDITRSSVDIKTKEKMKNLLKEIQTRDELKNLISTWEIKIDLSEYKL